MSDLTTLEPAKPVTPDRKDGLHTVSDGRSPLLGLLSDLPRDVSRALLHGWGQVADILGFYNDRLADEGYLDTARETASVRWLAKMAGRKPRPQRTATVDLQVRVTEASGQPQEVTLSKAGEISVQNAAQLGESAAVFETTEATTLSARWNAMTSAAEIAPRQAIVAQGSLSIAIATGSASVREGDGLLLTLTPVDKDHAAAAEAQSLTAFASVDATESNIRQDVTILRFKQPLNVPGAPAPDSASADPEPLYHVSALQHYRKLGGLFGKTAAQWDELSKADKRKNGISPGGLLQLSGKLSVPGDKGEVPLWQNAAQGLPHVDVNCALQLIDKTVLAGTAKGVFRKAPGSGWESARMCAGTHEITRIIQTPETIHDNPSDWVIIRLIEKIRLVRGIEHLLGLDEPTKRDGVLYAGTRAGLVLMSTDLGASWSELGSSTSKLGAPINDLLVVPGPGPASDLVVAATGQGLQQFDFSSNKWTGIEAASGKSSDPKQLTGMAFHALAYFRGHWVAAGEHGLFKCDRGSKTWSSVMLPFSETVACTSMQIAHSGRTLFVGTSQGVIATGTLLLWKLFDKGLGDPAIGVTALCGHDGKLYAETRKGIYTSPDRHSDWTPIPWQIARLFQLPGNLAPSPGYDGAPDPQIMRGFALAGFALDNTARLTPLDPPPEGADAAWTCPAGSNSDDDDAFFLLVLRSDSLGIGISTKVPGVSGFAAIDSGVLAATALAPPINRQWPGYASSAQQLILDRKTPDLAPGDTVLVEDATAASTLPQVPQTLSVASSSKSLHKAFGKSANVTQITLAEPHAPLALADLRRASVFVAKGSAVGLAPAAPERPLSGDSLALGSPAKGLEQGRKLVLSGPRRALVKVPDPALGKAGLPTSYKTFETVSPDQISPELDQGFIGKSAAGALKSAGFKLSAKAQCSCVYTGASWVLRDGDKVWHIAAYDTEVSYAQLSLLECCSLDDEGTPVRLIASDGTAQTIGPKEVAIWQSPASWQIDQFEEGVLASQDDQCVLEAAITTPFDRAQLRVSGNIVAAEQSESIAVELLASAEPPTGGSSGEGRSFTLQHGPLAFASPGIGIEPQPLIEVYVDPPQEAVTRQDTQLLSQGQRWLPTHDLACASASDRVFQVEIGPKGAARLRFGDGRHGAALPAGKALIAASYRIGGGAGGNVAAGQLKVVRRRPSGVAKVSNPFVASGGSDAEPTDTLRRRTLQSANPSRQIVTLDDYAAYARDFHSVAAAKVFDLAAADTFGPTSSIGLSLVWEDTPGTSESAQRTDHLYDLIVHQRLDHLPLYIGAAETFPVAIALTMAAKPKANREVVRQAVVEALFDALGKGAWGIGEELREEDLTALIKSVPGAGDVSAILVSALSPIRRPAPLPLRPEPVALGDDTSFSPGEVVLVPSVDEISVEIG